MRVTEKEAKEKWCPLVRMVAAERNNDGALVPTNNTSFNRCAENGDTKLPAGSMCVGKICMLFNLSTADHHTGASYFECGLKTT